MSNLVRNSSVKNNLANSPLSLISFARFNKKSAISATSHEDNMPKISRHNNLLLFEICARAICEMFVNKYSATMDEVEN